MTSCIHAKIDTKQCALRSNKDIFDQLISIKQLLATNRDGLTVGSTIKCSLGNFVATVVKDGYTCGDRMYNDLRSMTSDIIGKKVKSNVLTLWTDTETGLTIREMMRQSITQEI